MENLKAENEKIKNELVLAKKIIVRQGDIINHLENDFAIRLYTAIEQITTDYSTHLNPEPVKIKTSDLGNQEEFLIKVSDIICILSDGRMKHIYLKSKIENKKGRYRETELITVNDNDMGLEALRHHLDSISYHLIQVRRNAVVNLKYYSLNKETLQVTSEELAKRNLPRLKITKAYKEDFIERKLMLNKIISLQEKLVRYIA